MHTDQWRNDGYVRRLARASPLARGHLDGHAHRRRDRAVERGWAGCRSTRSSTATRSTSPTRPGRRRRRGAPTRRRTSWTAQLKPATCKLAIDDVDAPENWPRTLVLWRSNLFGSSAKGNEYFLKHLLGTHSNLHGQRALRRGRPEAVTSPGDETPRGQARPAGRADFRMTSTTLLSDVVLPGGHLVREARPVHAPTCTRSCTPSPRRSTRRGRPRPTSTPSTPRSPRPSPDLARTHLGTRRDLVAVPLQHDTPGQIAQPGGKVYDWKDTDLPAVPGRNLPNLVVVERDYTAIADKLATVGPLADRLGLHRQERHLRRRRAGGPARPRCNGVMPAAPASGRPGDRHRPADGRGDPGASPAPPTARWPSRGSSTLEKRVGKQAGRPRRGLGGEADHLRRHPGSPGAGDHLAGVVGLGDRRPPLRAVHRQHRTAQAVAHPDRADALLPRPRLDDRRRGAVADVPAAAGHAAGCSASPSSARTASMQITVRYLTAALEVVDPLRVPGQPVHALALPRRTDGRG